MTDAADIAAHRRAYAEGATDPVAVAERFLTAQPVGGPLDAFISVDPDAVRAEATESAQRHADGAPIGPLDGILVGIKDFFAVRGHLSRGGTSFLAEQREEEAELVTRLRRAGAIIAGKNRTTELGLSPIGVNVSGGSPRNPHDTDRVTGGSSSGAGAAVAGGLVPLAVGTDGGGSVRIPPALCGIFGLKPTFGRIPADGAMNVGWWSLDHPGPIARSVGDLAVAYAVLAGVAQPDLDGGLDGVRVGVDWQWWGEPDADVDALCRAIADDLGAKPVRVEHLELARIAEYVTVGAEVATAMHDELRHDPSRFGLDVQAALQAASATTAVDYLRAQQARTLLDHGFAAAFADADVLVTPTTACTTPAMPPQVWTQGLLDEPLLQRLTAYSFPANLVGAPAITLPVGTDRDGMPVGVQLSAPRGREDLLLQVAAALEQRGMAVPPRPKIWNDPLHERSDDAVQEASPSRR